MGVQIALLLLEEML